MVHERLKTVGLDVADTCDGVEQEAFEAWAKAGITHARQRILSAIEAPAALKGDRP